MKQSKPSISFNEAFLLVSLLFLSSSGCSSEGPVVKSTEPAAPLWGDVAHGRPSCIRGIHLTSWYTGTKNGRAKFEKLLAETELNTVVIDIKESEGDVYIPGIELDGKPVFVSAIRDLKEYITYLKDRGIYTVARIVVFHDNRLAKQKPEWAVRSSTPLSKAVEKGYRADVWVDRKGSAWADPYREDVWDYNISIGLKAIEYGFQEIQFDYIRFPSDGNTKACIYSKPHNSATSVQALETFLAKARKKFNSHGVPLSIDVFGLTGSYNHDLGIGQKLDRLIAHVDIISPMMYPSHYYPGEYGLKDPNNQPYDTIFRSIRDTKKIIKGHNVELRPWLQDFSLGVKYDGPKVRDQIEAALDQGVGEWLLWNPGCRYTRDGLLPLPEPAIPAPPAENN